MPSATTEALEASPRSSARDEDAAAAKSSGKRPADRWRPAKAAVLRRLDHLSRQTASGEARRMLRKLARRIAASAGSARRLARVDTAVKTMVDAAGTPAEGPLLLEAATWVIAWRQGSRHPADAASLASELLELAAEANHRLADGDTTPAAFALTASRLLEGAAGKKRAASEPPLWAACEAEIERLVTPAGHVSLEGSAAVVSRVARWTHVRETATATAQAIRKPKQAFARKAERRWQQAITQTLRLLGPDGRPVCMADEPPLSDGAAMEIVKAALNHGSKAARKTARLLLKPTAQRRNREAALLDLSLDDRTSAVVVLRSSWQGRPVRVLLDYRNEQPHLEVIAGETVLLAGPWQWQVQLAGSTLAAEGPWQVTHHEDDDDVTLFVISAMLAEGLRLERHLLLGREDRVMLLADAVVDTADGHPADLIYRGSLPVAANLDVTAAEETRELTLGSSKPEAMLMPLALPEWTCGHTPHTWGWNADTGAVQLEQHAAVRRLFAPVWIDLAARRFSTQVTWRQLTVADTRVILRPEQAAGFRMQAGLDQWLLYRALDEPRNRTVLGCNLSSYFRLGRIDDDGLVSQMAEW